MNEEHTHANSYAHTRGSRLLVFVILDDSSSLSLSYSDIRVPYSLMSASVLCSFFLESEFLAEIRVTVSLRRETVLRAEARLGEE